MSFKLLHQPISLLTLAIAFLVSFGSTSFGQSEKLSELIRSQDKATVIQAALDSGDAKQGAILFHQATMQCSKCHAVGSQKSPLGPNLAVWDEPAKREHLLESLLEPSKIIRKGFETVRVLTEDEQVVTGILVSQSESALVMRDASGNGQEMEFEIDSLEQISKPAQSIMPEGLVDQLANVQQFYDLLRYVIEIAEQGPDRAAELQPPKSLTDLPPLPEYEEHIDHAGFIASFDRESFNRGKKIYNRVCANCHGTHDREGSLPTSPKFASSKLKNGSDPFRMYQTLTHGYGLMVAQRWMVPQQKYDVINYIQQAYFRSDNKDLYREIDEDYLAALPKGDTRGPEPSLIREYITMNYGSSLNHTYEIALNNDGDRVGRDLGRGPKSNNPWANPDEYFPPGEAPNYAYKGIAVRLDTGPGGITRGKKWVVYDHDTMNMHAAWQGDSFIDYCCIQFDGQHNTHNRLTGNIEFENPVGPGWGQPLTGVFYDPRPVGRDGRPYGPLPSAWYKYQGLYHYEDKTILSYRVGNAQILEMPAARTEDSFVVVRNLQVDPAEHDLKLRLAPASNFARVQGDSAKIIEVGGYLTLLIPRRQETVEIAVEISSSKFATQTAELEPIDFVKLTSGGPKRWKEPVKTTINTVFDDAFAVDELTLPTANPWNAQVRATGIDFFEDDDTAALCTWDGDVWFIEGLSQDQGELTWHRIASGMFQPLGLKIVDEQVYVTCRDQLVVLRDLNGDRETDFYECFNSDHQVTEHFHEFAMGLQVDEEGNFYYAKSGRHAKRAVVPHHGTLLKVSKDGRKTDVIATGFRAANGVCINPDGSFFVTDQEGHWNPKNRINWVTEGGFYGNMYSFTDVTDSSDEAMSQPLCWITNAFDRSPAELLWVPEGAWGPLSGSLLNLSYGYGKIFVVPHESVAGQLQGGMCQLPIPDMPSGLVRGRFHPTRKDLYACGMFSWAGSRQAPGCFHRIRYTNKPSHLPLELRAREQRLEIGFADVLDANSIKAEQFKVKSWDLKRTPNYGSKHYNEKNLKVDSASLGADGKTVVVSIPDLAPSWGMSVEYKLRGQSGKEFKGVIHNSIYNIPNDAETE